VIDSLLSFVWKYLAGPVVADAKNAETAVWQEVTAQTGYNPVNTVAWAVIAGGIIYGAYLLFRRQGLEFDQETALYSTPYILLGGLLRFTEDASVVGYPESILLITPVIYVIIAIPYLAVSVFSSQGDWNRNILYSGIALLVPGIALAVAGLESFSPGVLLPVLGISGVLTLLLYGAVRDTVYDRKDYLLAGFSQFFGGVVSMMAVEQGYIQKQLLAQTSTQLLGSPGILVVKSLVLAVALWTASDMEDDRMESLIILGLLAIGLGTGLRVLLRLLAGL
jgi:uncharacterized membrane protein